MKRNITHVVVGLLLLVLSTSHAAQRVTPKSGSFLIFQEGRKLQSVDLRTGRVSVLRDVFLYDKEYQVVARDWQMSPDGRRLAFTDYPRDIEFFNAAAWRRYLWTVAYNGKQRVLLAAYGPRADQQDYSFETPSWSADGKQLLLSRVINGNSPEPQEIALYDVASRREAWNSSRILARVLPAKQGVWNNLAQPALSPDGSRIICIATPASSDGFSSELPLGRKASSTSFLLFNIKAGQGRIVGAIDDQFSVPRYRFEGKEQISSLPIQPLVPQFAWHPSGKKVAFVGPDSPTHPKRDVFVLDLGSGKIVTLVSDAGDNFSPQWSQDGKFLYWIHGNVKPEKSQSNQIYCSRDDGANAKVVLPQIKGVTQIQLLPQVANWSRYRKLSIEPLAGADK